MRWLASFASISTQALAPSESCEALPAVMQAPCCTFWPFANTGFSAARPASVVSARGPSSCFSVTSLSETAPVALSVTFITVASGAISCANRPAAWAAAVRCWDWREYASCASREIL